MSADSPIKETIYHLILVSSLEHQEECSKEISSRRAKGGLCESVEVALCKAYNCVRNVHEIPRLRLHFYLLRAVRNLRG